MVLGCGFVCKRRRAVLAKIWRFKGAGFCAGRGCACRQNLRARSLGKIYAFASNL